MKKYLFFGLGLVLLGVVLGAGGAHWQMAMQDSGYEQVSVPAVDSAIVEPINPPAERAGGQATEQGSPPIHRPDSSAAVSGAIKSEPAQPVGKPEVKAAVKVNPCESAKKDLAAALAAAQKAKEDSLAAAKKTLDIELAGVDSKLADLTTTRNQAVNDYLTAIALATAKYNSSKAADAYAIYQTDQAAALDGYAKKIAEIAAAEGPLQKAKKDAEEKYTAGAASADIKFISDKTAAEGAYAAKTGGQAC